MSIPPGKYTIKNVHYRNLASLPNANDQAHLICTIASSVTDHVTVTDAEQWNLIPQEDRYLIQNVESKNYVKAAANARENENVYATSQFSHSWWKIRMTADSEQYFVSPLDDLNLCWNLPEERDGTPVCLQPTSSDKRCLWMISPSPPLINRIRIFVDALTVQLNLAEPTHGRREFPVQIDLEGMPPSSVIRILDPVSVVFGGRVIAEALMPSLATANAAILFATLRVRDNTGFLTFATSVLQNKKIQVDLRADRLNLYSDLVTEEQTAVYCMVKALTFQGFDSFRGRVKLSDVRITGSNGSAYINGTAVAIITNSSRIDITVSGTVTVYYRQIQIGVAVINTRRLHHGANKLRLEWQFEPPRANEDVQNFLNRYITTDEAIPVLLQVEDICPIICNHPFDLPSLDVHSSIPGLNSRPVCRVDAYLGLAIFFRRTVAFVFEFENPLDCELTIVSIELEAFVHKMRIITVNHSFNSFIIPGRSRKKSPEINDAHLVQGYVEALQRVAQDSATLDVNVTSASFRVENFELHNLKFNLKEIPFSVHIRL